MCRCICIYYIICADTHDILRIGNSKDIKIDGHSNTVPLTCSATALPMSGITRRGLLAVILGEGSFLKSYTLLGCKGVKFSFPHCVRAVRV